MDDGEGEIIKKLDDPTTAKNFKRQTRFFQRGYNKSKFNIPIIKVNAEQPNVIIALVSLASLPFPILIKYLWKRKNNN